MKRLLAVILLIGIHVSLNAVEIEDQQKACSDGIAVTCQNLGDIYYKGKKVKQNYLEAVNYYGKACDAGYIAGCSALAFMYEEAQGVNLDYAKAVKLYAKACVGYDFKGCHRSGILYQKGLGGTEQSFLKAKEFFTKACSDGDPRALQIYEELFGDQAPENRWNKPNFEDTNLSDSSDKNAFSRVKENGEWGIMDTKGEWLFKPQFDEIVENDYVGSLVHDGGLFLVVYEGKKGIVNTKGKWLIREYDEILYGQENLIVDINNWIKVKRNSKWGAINSDGEWIFKPQFDDVAIFTVQGQLTVKYNGKWGFIDTKGKWILEPKYDDVSLFAETDATGFGRITHNGKEGYISDVDGLLLEPILDRDIYSPDLESMFVFQKTGLLKVGSKYTKMGVIDTQGKWILKQKFDHIEILNDRIHVKFGDQEGYTMLDGKYLTFTKEGLINERYKDRNSRIYPFVCYAKKIKTGTDKTIYQECVRSETKCNSIEKSHFGEYPNDLKAYEAFKRCSK